MSVLWALMNAHKTVTTQKGTTRAAAELDINCIAMENVALVRELLIQLVVNCNIR